MLTFENYEKIAMKNKVYGYGTKILYPTLGLTGEAGEVADKVKKVLRDHNGDFDISKSIEIAKELGDVLWYITAMANDLGFDLDMIAQMNLDKVLSRKHRNVINGEGDNR